MKTFSPAVSVIVPVFNAEKYLGVCLESILIQTFTDFEVIVVDDCSTDKSLTVAESFQERFNGRLKIISLEENTGSGSVPRNVGLELSRGKYVFFVDDDDLILDTALEELFNAAETFQADVVYTDRGFTCGEEIVPTELVESFWNPPKFAVTEPTLETENLSERVEKYLKLAFGMPPWEKFFRRNFLVDNEIKLPTVKISDDIIWTFEIICLAKKILRLPTPLYIHRRNNQSVMNRKLSPADQIKLWTNPLLNGVDYLNEFMNGFDVFNSTNDLRLRVLKFFAKIQLDFMAEAFKALDANEVYEIFLREFSSTKSPHAALISFLLVMNNLDRNEMMR